MNDEKNRPATLGDLEASEQRLTEAAMTMKDDLIEEMRKMQTEILRAFHGFVVANNARVGHLEAGDTAIAVRMSALEMRVLELETRKAS